MIKTVKLNKIIIKEICFVYNTFLLKNVIIECYTREKFKLL